MNKQPQGLPEGIYYDLDAETYHADPALSSSGLRKLLDNPLDFWWTSPMNPNREPVETAAMKSGTAFHTLLLEPEKFDQLFAIKPGVKTTTVKGMIGEGDYKIMQEAVAMLKSSPVLSQLFVGGNAEVSIFWRDEETGIMCRARFDYLTPFYAVDYKTTTDITTQKLGYTVCDYGYDVQAAMYMNGLDSLRRAGIYEGDPHNAFIFCFQRKAPPSIARALRMHETILSIGAAKYRRGLQLYAAYLQQYGTNQWPAGFDDLEDMTLDHLPYKFAN